MKISRALLNKIVNEEINLISEGCGCGCNGKPGGCGNKSYEDIETLDSHVDDSILHDSSSVADTEFLTREETLKAVVALAMSTSCPVTRDSLLVTVRELM
jgi:hypothetical protein|tara:strand:- start:737 stop:1036 length:300 start_codon:yes stop_codon:yes gene_type:complete